MTETKLPTIKDLEKEYPSFFSPERVAHYLEALKDVRDKVLLAHKERAKEEYEKAHSDWEDTFDRWDKFIEEELTPLLEDAELLDRFADLYGELTTDAFMMNRLKGELDKVQSLRGTND